MKRSAAPAVLASLLLLLLALPALANDTVEVVQSVPLETSLAVPGIRQTQEVWLEMIGSAQHTLDLEQFYVSDQAGQSLEPVLAAISKAASRGVHVRLIADSKFFQTYPDSVGQIGRLPGAESRIIDFSNLGGVQHAKYFVVDGKQAFVGSQNFDWRALSHIHEIGLRVSDAKIGSDLESIFEKDWSVARQKAPSFLALGLQSVFSMFAPPQESTAGVSVAASPAQVNPAGIPDSLTAITSLIGSAQHSVRVQVMEYSTQVYGSPARWRALDDALRGAAQHGVRVQLMLDAASAKKAKFDLRSLVQVRNVEIKTVTIPAFSGGAIDHARLIHSKYLVVDGNQGWVGSENWSQGYFMNTRDVGLMVNAPDVAAQLDQVFDRVWTSSYASSY